MTRLLDVLITGLVLGFLSCSGPRAPGPASPHPSSAAGDGGDVEAGCWDENPCTGSADLHCLPPGSPRPTGKAPEGEDLAFVAPSPCETDGDCSPVNELCREGACVPRSCGSSDECDGYCIGGQCWPEPGFCEDYLKP
jgi:hypothetical protein